MRFLKKAQSFNEVSVNYPIVITDPFMHNQLQKSHISFGKRKEKSLAWCSKQKVKVGRFIKETEADPPKQRGEKHSRLHRC